MTKKTNFKINLFMFCSFITIYTFCNLFPKPFLFNKENINIEDSILMQTEAIINKQIHLTEVPSKELIEMDNPYDYYYRDLYQILSLRKKQSYSYESEYRIGIPLCDEMIDGCHIHKEFFVKNNTIKPCLEFKKVPLSDIIEDVVISPFNTNDCVCLGVEEFLRNKTNKNIKVESTKIDIRE